MHRQFIAETTLGGLRPLSVGGHRVHDAWQQIDAYLRQSLGDSYANLFSEPVQGERGAISWFAAVEGDVRPYVQLDDDSKQNLLNEVRQLINNIEQHIVKLQQSAQDSDRRLAETLKRAISIPDPQRGNEFLYAVDAKPVLVNWGTRDDIAEAREGILQDFIRREQAQTQPPPVPVAAAQPHVENVVVVERNPSWLLWLLFLLLIAAIFYTLLYGCGFGWQSPWLDYCPASVASNNAGPLAQEKQRTLHLQQQISRLEKQFAMLPHCGYKKQYQGGKASAATPPKPDANNEFEKRIQAHSDKVGIIDVALIWEGDADLDLYINCPNGDAIDFRSKKGCGGILDIDINKSSSEIVDKPIERIQWSENTAPKGSYKVSVSNYQPRSAGDKPVAFSLRIKVGDKTDVYNGQVNREQRKETALHVASFEVR